MKTELANSLISEFFEAQKALDSLREYLGHALPHDLEVLANEIGLEVIYTDEIPDKVGGFLSGISDSGGNLVVNSNKSRTYQLYSIAHEIGHFWLYHDLDDSGNSYQNEQKANTFAFVLLNEIVPSDQLRLFLKENPELFQFTYTFGATAIGLLFSRLPWLGIPLIILFSLFMVGEALSDTPALPPVQEDKP